MQLEVIPRTKNKFVEMVSIAECYLNTNHVKISMKQPFRICIPVKLADERMSVKKEKNYSHLIYNIFSARWLEKLFHEDKLSMKLRLSNQKI